MDPLAHGPQPTTACPGPSCPGHPCPGQVHPGPPGRGFTRCPENSKCVVKTFSMMRTQRPPQFHETPQKLENQKQNNGRERKNLEILAPTRTAPTWTTPTPTWTAPTPTAPKPHAQPTATHPGGRAGARKSFSFECRTRKVFFRVGICVFSRWAHLRR